MMDLFLTAFITLFVVVDPLGTSSVFAGLTQGYTDKEKYKIALKATGIAILVFIVFGVVGHKIFFVMGISAVAFKIAGGILLFYTAFSMVMHGRDRVDDRVTNGSQNDISVFPMAIPLMAGPGCITAYLLLLEQGHFLSTTLAMLIVECITLAVLLMASKLCAIFNHSVLDVVSRIAGVLLAALSIQFIMDGVMFFIHG